jgi:hypothetical protein
MIPIAIYKRHEESSSATGVRVGNMPDGKSDIGGGRSEERSQRKNYVWLHPPRKIELNVYDEIFVLCEKNEKDEVSANEAKGQNESQGSQYAAANMKNEGKKQ